MRQFELKQEDLKNDISPEKRQKIIKIIIKSKNNKSKNQKTINLSDNTSNQPSKLKTKSWVEINELCATHYTNSQIKFKTSMLKSSLCNYS